MLYAIFQDEGMMDRSLVGPQLSVHIN